LKVSALYCVKLCSFTSKHSYSVDSHFCFTYAMTKREGQDSCSVITGVGRTVSWAWLSPYLSDRFLSYSTPPRIRNGTSLKTSVNNDVKRRLFKPYLLLYIHYITAWITNSLIFERYLSPIEEKSPFVLFKHARKWGVTNPFLCFRSVIYYNRALKDCSIFPAVAF